MEKRFKIVKGIILMEEIIERLKDKTFTQEDIEKLYDYYKNSENKELAMEVSELYKYARLISRASKQNYLLCPGCITLHQRLEYYNTIYDMEPLVFPFKISFGYNYIKNLSVILEMIYIN